MTPETWARVCKLFAAITERASEERSPLLDELCRDEPTEVRRELERMLQGESSGDDFLEDPIARLSQSVPRDLTAPEQQLRAGPYRLLRPIGRGAMSDVFLATRDDDSYERHVAIKLVRWGPSDSGAVKRFLAERRILASLDHENIARFHDCGTASDGRPYLAMELVDGVPLTRYCDRHSLSIKRRLNLFLDVCSAVDYAHRNLLVHRDLKPGNILVTRGGTPKLLDFGIAKLLGPLGGLEPGTTHTGLRPMTPLYASPEQVRSDVITTTSDVYSLGVLLYELLTGRLPYRLESERQHELERAICDQEALLPSVEVNRRGPADPRDVRRAQARACGSMGELRKRLAGDLDTIVSKALRKETDRRYDSVRQLAADIERHLARRPIVARQDQIGYRLHRFARRNASTLAVVCGGLLLSSGFVAALGWQAGMLERARSGADRISALLARLDTSSTSGASSAGPSADQVLAMTLNEVSGRVLDDPEALGEMLETLGGVYRRAGRTTDAVALFRESLAARQDVLEPTDPAVASSLHRLGVSLVEGGELVEGEAHLRSALALRRRGLGASWALAESVQALGAHLWRMGDFAAAESLLMESVEVRVEICPDGAGLANGLSDLAAFRLERLHIDAGAELLERARRIRVTLGDSHFDAPRSLEDRALLHFAQGKPKEAERLFAEAIEQRLQRAGEAHGAIAEPLTWRARALLVLGRHEEAVESLRRAIEIRSRLQLGIGPQQDDILKSLAVGLAAGGAYGPAVELLERVRDGEVDRWSADHPRVAWTRTLLAGVLLERGDRRAAVRQYGQAALVLKHVPEWRFGAAIEAQLALASLAVEDGAPTAEVELRGLVAHIESSHPPGHWRTAVARSLLGSAMTRTGPTPEGTELLTSALEALESRLGRDAPLSLQAAERVTRWTAGP